MKKSGARRTSAVVDTNIWISALIGSASCGDLYDLFAKLSFDLIVSDDLMEEYRRTFKKPKFLVKIKPMDRKRFFDLLVKHGFVVRPSKSISACRDPKDNMVLECAVAGGADFIVTGDEDLLVLKQYKKIKILPPSAFIALFK